MKINKTITQHRTGNSKLFFFFLIAFLPVYILIKFSTSCTMKTLKDTWKGFKTFINVGIVSCRESCQNQHNKCYHEVLLVSHSYKKVPSCTTAQDSQLYLAKTYIATNLFLKYSAPKVTFKRFLVKVY